MRRGQATIEYAALLATVLVAGCLLIRFATPVERLSLDLARAVLALPRPHHRPPRHRHTPIHPVHHSRQPCRCPFSAQSGAASDD